MEKVPMRGVELGGGAEFDLIRSFLGTAAEDSPASHHVQVGPGDDCAVLRGGMALSMDMSIEGVHFLREWLEPEEIGYRAAAAAMSDLAAVAAAPLGVLAALAAREDDTDTAVRVMAGVRALARSQSAALLGGDFTRSPGPLVIDIVAVGTVTHPVLRSGAAPGDGIWVTGTLGGAAAAVQEWRAGRVAGAAARDAFARPRPRTAEAVWLAQRGALSALIDLSDGLAGDVGHVAAASGACVIIDASSVPIHAAARDIAQDEGAALRLALAGGEDYELCLAAPPGAVEALVAAFTEQFGVRLTRVGEVVDGSGVRLRNADGGVVAMPYSGHDHLASRR
jgi:thiamine-monophosphate kinase